MKLNTGMRCHDICKKTDMKSVFATVRENGISTIQLALSKSISDLNFATGRYSPGYARLVADELKANGIHVAVLGCYINPVNPVESERRAAVDKFKEHLKYARILGADMVGTETGRLNADFKPTPESYTEDAYRLLLKSMEEIVADAERLGVIVGVEGVFNHTLYSPARMKRFLDDIASPNVEVILDPVNLIHPYETSPESQKRVIDQAFSYYGGRISVLHVKDFVFEGENQIFRHVGEGLFKYELLLKHVKEEKPYITMLLENSTSSRFHSDVAFLQEIYDSV